MSPPSPSRAQEQWRKLRLHVKAASAFAPPSSWRQAQEAGLLGEDTQPGPALAAGLPLGADVSTKKDEQQVEVKGRKRLEGLVVKQERSFISTLQDFYVSTLKLPPLVFFLGIFLTPLALSFLFTPLYLLDLPGLQFDEGLLTSASEHCTLAMGAEEALPESFGPVNGGKEELEKICHQNYHVLFTLFYIMLYSLSLSTTFGGTPVQAKSPYTLILANLQTMIAQFTFVFLSGAVFARMSQRAQPVRCAKKAVIRPDDILAADDGETSNKKFRCFAARLVLTGAMPVELVGVRISLTFRIFVRQASGSIFCSTHSLDVVRPEVAYLRYGLLVRHVIDEKSEVYGHTKESLLAGDASFSLAVMGTERASMQDVFHMQDYFMSDGDIVWDGDYLDFVSVSRSGRHVLDHSKLDTVKTFKVAGSVTKFVSRVQAAAKGKKSTKSPEAARDAGLVKAGEAHVESPGKSGSEKGSRSGKFIDLAKLQALRKRMSSSNGQGPTSEVGDDVEKLRN